jgi:hypothetical protein
MSVDPPSDAYSLFPLKTYVSDCHLFIAWSAVRISESLIDEWSINA